MTFNDFKAYRAILKPYHQLKKWRAMPKPSIIGAIILLIVGGSILAVVVRAVCLLIASISRG